MTRVQLSIRRIQGSLANLINCGMLMTVAVAAAGSFPPWRSTTPATHADMGALPDFGVESERSLFDGNELQTLAYAPARLNLERVRKRQAERTDPALVLTASPLGEWDPIDRWMKGYAYRFDFFLGYEF